MKKVLFIPSDHGGGRGHVSRCLYLAKQFKAQGFDSAIVLEKKHYQDGFNAGLTTYLFDTRWERLIKYQLKKPHKPMVRLLSKPAGYPVFIAFSSLAYQAPRDGYVSEKITSYRLKLFDQIFTRFKPDVLVGDAHFLTYILGKKYNLPVVQITRLAGYPPEPKFFWWDKHPPAFVEPAALRPFQSILDSMKMNYIDRVEDLLIGDHYLIPASRELEPVKRRGRKVTFTGPLAELSPLTRPINYFLEQNEYPKIYVTIGGGAGRNQEQTFFETILNVFNKSDYRVLVSTAGRAPAKLFRGRSANVLFVDWIDGQSAIRQSDLVVHHGGYGTIMETLVAGKPSLIIPSHSEQEGNGRRLELLGVGKTILPFIGELEPLVFTWPFGDYHMRAATEFQLEKTEILEQIHHLLYNSEVYSKLKELGSSLNNLQQKIDISDLLNF